MASTNKTTNYDLSQFIETDKPGWLTDYNSDMRKLDTALKGVSDVASGASGSITDLANRMINAEGNIITNANDIDALEARADSLEAQAQSSAGAIANIQTEQTAQNLGIEAATELGYNLARPYDSASTYAVGAYVLFQNTLYKCITAVSTGEAFDPTKWLAIKATDEIAAGGYTLPIASASQLGGVKVGDGLNIDESGSLYIPISTTPFISVSDVTSSSFTFSGSSTMPSIKCYKIGDIEILTVYIDGVYSRLNSEGLADGSIKVPVTFLNGKTMVGNVRAVSFSCCAQPYNTGTRTLEQFSLKDARLSNTFINFNIVYGTDIASRYLSLFATFIITPNDYT